MAGEVHFQSSQPMLRSYTQLHGPRRGDKVGTHPRKAALPAVVGG